MKRKAEEINYRRWQEVYFTILLGAVFLLITCWPSDARAAKWTEADYVNTYCNGKVEYRLFDRTRVDCLTEFHAIEYDYGHKWAEAIGQSLYYSVRTGRKAGIVLIIDPKHNKRYLTRLNDTIEAKKLSIKVWVIYKKG